jgi:GPH family glycoside/pentoside/hexuronide:cation symporter
MAETRLTRLTKIVYGSGDSGLSLTLTTIGVYFSFFLTNTVGLSPVMAALAICIGRIWDVVNDPLIGYLSDRTRTRWGRRRPFLLFGALPFAFMFTLMWWKPPLTGTALVVYYAAAYLLFDTAATFVYMPYFALTPELSRSYDERTSLTSYRMFFSIIAGLVAFAVPSLVIGKFGPGSASKMLAIAAVFGLASALPLLIVFLGVRERKEYSEAAPPQLLKALKAAFQNPPLLFSLGIYVFTWVTIDLMQTILLYFIAYCVMIPDKSMWLMLAIFATAICVLPFWNWAAGKWGKKTAYIAGVALWAVVQMVLITLGPSSGFPLILGLCVLAGIGVGAAHVLPWAILPDAVEWDEWKTGERHEGIFYSLVTLCQKCASVVAIPLALFLLGAFGYVPGGTAAQPESAVFAIRLITGPIPAVLLGCGILCAVFYPVTRGMHARIIRELEERRGSSHGVDNMPNTG